MLADRCIDRMQNDKKLFNKIVYFFFNLKFKIISRVPNHFNKTTVFLKLKNKFLARDPCKADDNDAKNGGPDHKKNNFCLKFTIIIVSI